MRIAAVLLAGVLWLAVTEAPASAMPAAAPQPATSSQVLGLAPPAPGAAAARTAPVVLARCGPRCRAHRRALRRHYRRHHWRPYRPRPQYRYYRERRRDAAAAAIIGGVIGLGVGAAIANSRPRYYGNEVAPEFAVPGR